MKKILIVDSDQQVSAILELKLKQSNFEIKTLTRTVNALKTVKEFKPDLIISEMVLPELSGVDFLKRVKMNPDTSMIPFMFLSSSRNVEDKILAHEMGAEAFFMKPIFIKVLIQRIKDFFEQADFNEMLSKSAGEMEYSGNLTNVSIIDIMNIIGESKSTGKVELQNATGQKAKIFFTNGSVIRAENEGSENRVGEQEVFSVLSWLDGSFTVSYEDVNVRRNIRTSHDDLIVNAVNWLDDYTGELSVMPPLDTKLYLDFRKFMNEINKYPDKVSSIVKNIGAEGSRLSDIIDRTELDRKQTVSYLKKLIDNDVVTIEKKDTGFTLPEKPEWLEKRPETEIPESNGFEDVLDKLDPVKEVEKEEKEYEKTIVPPPDLIDKNTIDPAVDISIQPTEENKIEDKTQAPKPGLIDSVSLNFGIDFDEPGEEDLPDEEATLAEEDLSLAVDSKQEENDDQKENPKTVLDEHLAGIKAENRSKIYSADSGGGNLKIVLFIIFVLTGASFATAFFLFPEKIDEISMIFKQLTETESQHHAMVDTVTEEKVTETEKPAHPDQAVGEKETVKLNENQKELLNNQVEALVDKAAALYEKERVEEAVEVNMVALYKLLNSEEEKGSVYEKVVTNMAIYYYMLDKGEEALKFAKESMELREDSKAIELTVAILDFLKRQSEAASLLRSKLDNPEYAEKKEEWIREINRLENLE